MKRLVSIICLTVLLMLTLSGCGKPTIEDCIAKYESDCTKIMNASSCTFIMEIVPHEDRASSRVDGLPYYLDGTITFDTNISNKQLYELIRKIEAIRNDNILIVNSYRAGTDYCYYSYIGDCVVRNGAFVYSPISEIPYSELGSLEKKHICDWIQSQYDRFDKSAGQYTGDKYSDTIFSDASELFGLSDSELKVIWMKKYDYK